MKFEAQRGDGALLVEGYAGQGFRAGGREWPGGVLLTPETAQPFEALELPGFDALDAADPKIELLLIGTGTAMRRPPAELVAALTARGFAVDFMDSRAAARTYNVLALEGRRVAAALLPL